MAEIKLGSNNFDNEITSYSGIALVDFWVSWCGPCKMLAPVIEEIASEYEGKIKVGKLNVDEAMDIAMRFKIDSIPTLIVFKNGEIVDTLIGYMPKESITKVLDSHI